MAVSKRPDGRAPNQLRPIKLTANPTRYAEGSCLIEFGYTQVLCTASLEPTVPKWMAGSGQGWVTAEYGMLPRSTHTRMNREKTASGGRTHEISRLIGRALRAGVDLKALGERQLTVDCDVLQADGGTRTAAVTGGFVALALALAKLKTAGLIASVPLKGYISAISVGLDGGTPLLDLCYEEDARIGTDMNVVMLGPDRFVEVQGTAEGEAFSASELAGVTELATKGCRELFAHQATLIEPFFPLSSR